MVGGWLVVGRDVRCSGRRWLCRALDGGDGSAEFVGGAGVETAEPSTGDSGGVGRSRGGSPGMVVGFRNSVGYVANSVGCGLLVVRYLRDQWSQLVGSGDVAVDRVFSGNAFAHSLPRLTAGAALGCFGPHRARNRFGYGAIAQRNRGWKFRRSCNATPSPDRHCCPNTLVLLAAGYIEQCRTPIQLNRPCRAVDRCASARHPSSRRYAIQSVTRNANGPLTVRTS